MGESIKTLACIGQYVMRQTVRDLAETETGLGTIGGEKADLVWKEACDDLDTTVDELSRRVDVSETHVRRVLKELPPESFGL